MNLVFFGSSSYSLPVLRLLIRHRLPPVLVVTAPDKPKGRHLILTPNPVKTLAQSAGIPVTESLTETAWPDKPLGLVAAYGKIIPSAILDKFNTQLYNIHPSLLPLFRGPSPLQYQLLTAAFPMGYSIFQIDPKMDHGPLLHTQNSSVSLQITAPELGEQLFSQGTQWFIDHFDQIAARSLPLAPQNHSLATVTRRLSRQDGFVPWADLQEAPLTAQKLVHLALMPDPIPLERAWRALTPWPGLWSVDPAGRRLKVTSSTGIWRFV